MNDIKKEIFECGGITGYLNKQNYKPLLRFLTCGSVDDGKSTLIGRLLYDACQIYDDHLSSLHGNSKFSYQNNRSLLNFASLVDGLQAERAQGITIDVAYRYFFTKHRKFIVADAPGHEEYTRNMVTAASTSDLAVLLVDARKGIRDQTRRHTFVSVLLGIRNLIIAINKMDLVNYDQGVFEKIKEDYLVFTNCFTMQLNIKFIPISALYGDNIIYPSESMAAWYDGLTLMDILDTEKVIKAVHNDQYLRFPVQYVNYDRLDFRGYSGTIASGQLYIGKKIKIFPSGHTSVIRKIITFKQNLVHAFSGDPITVVLENDLDINRGDLFLDINDDVLSVKSAQVDVVWMALENLVKGRVFNVQIAHRRIRAYVKFLHYHLDINNATYCIKDHLPLNGIGLVDLVFDEPILLDQYSYSPITGSMIFIDPYTNLTLGAGMVRLPLRGDISHHDTSDIYSKFELEFNSLICRYFPHWNVDNLSGKHDD